MKKHAILSVFLAGVLVSGCSRMDLPGITIESGLTDASVSTSETVQLDNIFTDRDYEVGYDESQSAIITLSGDSATCSSNAVQISGSTVTITDEGTYILSGTLDDGMVIVNAEKSDKTQLVLNNAVIHSETSAPIYIRQADKVFLTLAKDSVNTLSSGEAFTAIDENNVDAVIFSKEDLTLNGSGSLAVSSPAGHGIVSKDSLTITSGNYEINAASHGLAGKDNVCIANAMMSITSGKDGIHGENADDETKGYVYIESGTFHITAEGDGISASSDMQILGGSFEIVSGGGSVKAEKKTSDGWGGFMGGGRQPGGPMGQGNRNDITDTIQTEEDSTSIKGIKAGTNLTITGGNFTIDSADDAVHANGNLTVSGGTFDIATGDDGFHADETLTVSSGTIRISESYEGLEGLHIHVSGGEITLKASDDGFNAAGGTDQSGFGGHRQNDMFGGMHGGSASNGSIEISGGAVYINASGDGIDANGTLTISGGYTTVCGPTQGDTATLDYDSSATITGGTFVGTGASGMAQTFSDSEQGVIAVSVGNQSAGTKITLSDCNGKAIITYAPELSYGVVILSSPEVIKGENYVITVGSLSGEFEAY